MREVAIPTTLAIQHWQHHALRRRVHVGKRHGKCNKLNKLTCRVERDFCNKLTCRVERSSVTLLNPTGEFITLAISLLPTCTHLRRA